MNTKIVKLDNNLIDYNILGEAANIIKNGGLVVFPTDTVYGIGANIYNEKACLKIFEAKKRPADNPLTAHISCLKHVEDLALNVPEYANKLMNSFWPGALTLIFKKQKNIGDKVTGGLDSVGMRIPKNNIVTELIRLSGVPIAGTSANLSGRPSPTNVEHVIEDLYGRVDMIIDGGNTNIGLESTVLLTNQTIPIILRKGNITSKEIEKVIGMKVNINRNKDLSVSPGQKYKKYVHKSKIITFKGDILKCVKEIISCYNAYSEEGLSVGIICSNESINTYDNLEYLSLGSRKNSGEIAYNLFSSLRKFEKESKDIILIEPFLIGKDFEAIQSRIEKASDEIIVIE